MTIGNKLVVTDSLVVPSAGKYIRGFFQSVTGDSLGIIYYNTVAGRVDTVWAIQ